MLTGSNAASADGDPFLVASASSDGIIRVWDVRMANKEKPNPLAEASTKSRLTCLAGSSVKCKLSCSKIFRLERLHCKLLYILNKFLNSWRVLRQHFVEAT